MDYRDKKGRFLKGKQNPYIANLELGREWKRKHALTDEEKKERGWFFDGKIKYYWRNCNCCGKEYVGQGALFCSYTCSRLYAEAIKDNREITLKADLDINYQKRIRMSVPYQNWRKEIYKRDNYTCVLCGETEGQLDVDHYPESFSEILKENNIKNLKDSIFVDKLWDIANGRTLCIHCHRQTETYGFNNVNNGIKI